MPDPQAELSDTELSILATAAGTTTSDVENHFTSQDQIRIAKALALYISQH